MRMSRSWPASTAISALDALACRTTLDSASRSTASRCSAIRGGTSLSSRPSMLSPGMKPRWPRAPSTRSDDLRAQARRRRPRGELCSAKIVERICRMVPSSSSMAFCTRADASGRSTSRTVLISVIATANSRWMTTSCRSLAIRSRSSSRLEPLGVLPALGQLQRDRGLPGERRAACAARPG